MRVMLFWQACVLAFSLLADFPEGLELDPIGLSIHRGVDLSLESGRCTLGGAPESWMVRCSCATHRSALPHHMH